MASPTSTVLPAAPRSGITNAMSVDVEDYYHVSAFAGVVPRSAWPDYPARVEDSTRRVLDLFATAGVRATFFVLGCVAERHPRLVRDIVAAGHELASHGYQHYRVGEQTPRQFAEDVAAARKRLEDNGGVEVQGYRAASFSIGRGTWWAFEALAEAGYRYSSSIHPIRHDHYGVPDAPRFPFRPGRADRTGTPLTGIPLTEIPVATVELLGRRWPCGGGGFFRLFPYRWSRWAMRRINRREGQPATFYFHPWEIDPGQPRVAGLPARARFRHYVNLRAMEDKLRRLLADFAWSRIDTVHLPDGAPQTTTIWTMG